MVIAGAGGHALELLDILISQENHENLYFYDDINEIEMFQGKYPVIRCKSELVECLKADNRFYLGVGGPIARYHLYNLFSSLGGSLVTVKANNVALSNFSENNMADVFSLCFIGASTKLGRGTLINTGCQIHHETKVGDFTEINPGAILLGKCTVGDFCSVGSGATILPKVTVGNNVKVGAGTVVTKDIPDNSLVVGVPGKVTKHGDYL